MPSTLFKANKLISLEKRRPAYQPGWLLPIEYQHLVIPYAGMYFRQDKECDILSQHIHLGIFSFWLHDIFTTKNVILHPYIPYHIWSLHFMYEDSLQAESTFDLEERECNLFNLHPGLYSVPMPGGKKILSVHINILPEGLPVLAKRYPELANLTNRHTADISGTVNERPYHVNAVCDLLIKKIITCRYKGLHAYRFIHRCCVDLFLNFAHQDITANQTFLFTDLLYLEHYQQLFTYLIKHPLKDHSLSELAYMFYIPADQLAAGFRQHFSVTLETFTHMLKMMNAYDQLQKKPNAAIVGNVSGFSVIDNMNRLVEEYYECETADQ